jgi:hypothetical protein
MYAPLVHVKVFACMHPSKLSISKSLVVDILTLPYSIMILSILRLTSHHLFPVHPKGFLFQRFGENICHLILSLDMIDTYCSFVDFLSEVIGLYI